MNTQHQESVRRLHLIKELRVAVNTIKSGLGILQQSVTVVDRKYFLFMLVLSTGLERYMKVLLCLQSLDETGNILSSNELQNFGHNLISLNDAIAPDFRYREVSLIVDRFSERLLLFGLLKYLVFIPSSCSRSVLPPVFCLSAERISGCDTVPQQSDVFSTGFSLLHRRRRLPSSHLVDQAPDRSQLLDLID